MSSSAELPDPDAASTQWEGFDVGVALPEVRTGQMLFERYRVQRELGRGGFGVVLLADDEELGMPVAVKLVPDLVVQDQQAMQSLKREVLRGMALTHPNIVRTHNFERDETTAGIVMEFIDGRTLSELKVAQRCHCFDHETLLPWLEELCGALDYAHDEARIAHRDLKPGNLMVTGAGKLKIADFGIAAGLGDTLSRISIFGTISGTPTYMSPQQIMGAPPSRLDDIYALGSTIYDLLSGRPPFYHGHILRQVLQAAAPSIAERREELGIDALSPVPAAWERVIAACLAKRPIDRPQSAGEVLVGLTGRAVSRDAVTPRAAKAASALPWSVVRPHFVWLAGAALATAGVSAFVRDLPPGLPAAFREKHAPSPVVAQLPDRLPNATLIRGRITDEDGRPVRNTYVTFFGGYTSPTTHTDGDGRYWVGFDRTVPVSGMTVPHPVGLEPDVQSITVKLGETTVLDVTLLHRRILKFDYVYQPDGTRELEAANVVRGSIVARRPDRGINFYAGKVLRNGADDLQWRAAGGVMSFLCGYHSTKSNGFYDAGSVKFDEIKTATESGYGRAAKHCIVGHTYVVRTLKGHYAKLIVNDIVRER